MPSLQRDGGRVKLGARLRGAADLSATRPIWPSTTWSGGVCKNGSAPASTKAASRCAAAEDGCGEARAIARLGVGGFTSKVAAGLGVYDDG